MGVSNSIWFVIASALGQSNADVTPRSPSGRVVRAAWWFFILVLVASYTANLTAYLTIERMSSSAQTADELSRQTDVEYGAVTGGATFNFFLQSQLPTYQRMKEYMLNRGDEVMVNSTAEGVERVRNSRGGYAFILGNLDFISRKKSGLVLKNNYYKVHMRVFFSVIYRLSNKRI